MAGRLGRKTDKKAFKSEVPKILRVIGAHLQRLAAELQLLLDTNLCECMCETVPRLCLRVCVYSVFLGAYAHVRPKFRPEKHRVTGSVAEGVLELPEELLWTSTRPKAKVACPVSNRLAVAIGTHSRS